MLDDAIAQLPAEIALGHRPGDDPSLVLRIVVVRADSAGCSEKFAAAARSRNVGFSVVCRSNRQRHSAIFDTLGFEELWCQAVKQNGEDREGAAVIELTDLVTLPDWPEGTRLIVRREPLHPGVQHSLFPSLEYRYWGFYTDQDGDVVELDRIMRAHAHVEQHISRLKDSGLLSFPFTKIEANRNWMATVMMAAARSRPLVPAVGPRRFLEQSPAQGTALGLVPRAGPAGAQRTPKNRPHPRRLAERRRPHRRLRQDGGALLSDLTPRQSAPA